jgi:hypothetical protein
MRSPVVSRRASWTATTSKRDTTSAMHATACQSRFGESDGPESHFWVTPLKARMFHVAMSRFDGVLAGMTLSRLADSRSRSAVTAAGRPGGPPVTMFVAVILLPPVCGFADRPGLDLSRPRRAAGRRLVRDASLAPAVCGVGQVHVSGRSG